MSNCRYKKPREQSNAYNNWLCPFCQNIFRTRKLLYEHKKECKLNSHENIQKYIIDENGKRKLAPGSYAWNKGLTKETDERVRKQAETFSTRYKGTDEGKRIFGHTISEEHKQKMRKIAVERQWGGWRTSKTIKYNGVNLDSTYELKVAKELDENQIKWERPSYFLWEDSKGIKHRYYPDFYLPEYNIYLDPKNNYLINNKSKRFGITDVEKIELVKQQNKIRIIILDKDNLNWIYIKEKIFNYGRSRLVPEAP